MKYKKNRIISVISAFIISITSIGVFAPHYNINHVEAVERDLVAPEFDPYYFDSDYANKDKFVNQLGRIYNAFKNSSYSGIHCFVSGNYVYYLPVELGWQVGNWFSNYGNSTTYAHTFESVSLSSSGTVPTDFTGYEIPNSFGSPSSQCINTSTLYRAHFGQSTYFNQYNGDLLSTIGSLDVYNEPKGIVSSSTSPCEAYCFINFTFSYDPILSPILDYPYNLDVQTQSFTEWLIATDKYKEINSAMLSVHVNRYVELFAEYGGSLSFFTKWVSQYFSFLNISQGITDYNVILNKTRALYQEYLRAKADTVGNHLAPRVSSTIEPETNDNNKTLVTNTLDDTEIISLLRDILRALLSFPSTWYDMHEQLMIKLDELDLTTNIVNDGGSNDLDVLFNYDEDEFNSAWNSFEDAVNDEVNSKTALIESINNRSVMPENMLSDQTTFSLTVPLIDGYAVSRDGTSYSTNINNYTLDMSEHPTFDSVFKKIKRFIGVIMIIAYLVSLRYRIPRIVRGES